MKNDDKISKIIFYFENASKRTIPSHDSMIKKVRKFLWDLKPDKMWEEKGVLNREIGKSVYPDFVILLKNKVIACEVERIATIKAKIELYSGLKFFDEIWFFTNIGIKQTHFYYKLENNLRVKQKFFGLNDKGEFQEIKLPTESTVPRQMPRIYEEFFL